MDGKIDVFVIKERVHPAAKLEVTQKQVIYEERMRSVVLEKPCGPESCWITDDKGGKIELRLDGGYWRRKSP